MNRSSPMPSLVDDAPAGRSGGAKTTGTPGRKDVIKGVIAVVVLAVAGFILYSTFTGGSNPAVQSRTRPMIDRDTGELFEKYVVKDGMTQPYPHPSTGKLTLFPAEKCFWTKDGKAKLTPTYVLLREYKGEQGETLCPDCGKRVVPHNPSPPANLFPTSDGGASK